MTARIQRACQQLRRTPYSVQEYTEFTAPGILLEDAMSIHYWIHVIRQLRVNDIINVVAHDGSYDASLRIVRLGNSSVEFRVLREWRPAIEDTTENAVVVGKRDINDIGRRDHIVVCKNPEKDAVKWVMAQGSGNPLQWQFPLSANRQVCTQDAIATVIARALAVDLTISTASPQGVLDNPNGIPTGFQATVLCPEKSTNLKRWVILTSEPARGANDAKRSFSHSRFVVGQDIQKYLEDMASTRTDAPFEKSVFLLRPGMRAADFLTQEQMSDRPRSAA